MDTNATPSAAALPRRDFLKKTAAVTAAAAAALVRRLEARILEISFLIELQFLGGRQKLQDYPVRSLIVY